MRSWEPPASGASRFSGGRAGPRAARDRLELSESHQPAPFLVPQRQPDGSPGLGHGQASHVPKLGIGLRDTPLQDGCPVGREDVGQASRAALGARPSAACTAAPMLAGCIRMRLPHQTENAKDGTWVSAGRSRPRPRRCRAVTFVRSAVRRNPHRTDSAFVSASHVPLYYTACLRHLHSPPPRTSRRSAQEHPNAGGSGWCKRLLFFSTFLPHFRSSPICRTASRADGQVCRLACRVSALT